MLRLACLAVVALSCWLSGPLLDVAAGSSGPTPSFGGCSVPPAVTSAIPADVQLSQPNVNCFAWQEFIALNWLADPATCAADPSAAPSTFGAPTNTGPVVWQTYKGLAEVFLPDAKAPPGWCEPQSTTAAGGVRRPYRLSAPSKFALGPDLDLSDFHEASPVDSWLTAQNSRLTLYDIRINEDEFQYIDSNELYNADTQQKVASSSAGLSLPDQGTGVTKTGSTELKAAWIELDDPTDYSRFLTTKAVVTYPGQQPRMATMGLVGLHIIHKAQNAAQFVWATFEHVANAPSRTEVVNMDLHPPYTYFNTACDPTTDVYACASNPKQCTKVDPSQGCNKVDPYSAPEQVERVQAIPSSVTSLNEAVWGLIAKANPKSVFLNYQLVDVLWPNQSIPVSAGATVPLPTGDPQPPIPAAVANTTLETYVQTQSCLTCHVFAAVASTADPTITITQPVTATSPPSAAYAADYSFVLGHAQTPPQDSGTGTIIAGIAAGIALAGAAAVGLRRRSRRQGAAP